MIEIEIYPMDLIFDSDEDEGTWICISEIVIELPAVPRVGEFISMGLHPEESYEVEEVIWLMNTSPGIIDFKRVQVIARKVQP